MSATQPQPHGNQMSEASDPGTPNRLRRALETAVGAVFQQGNEVTVLKNGNEIFPAMLEAIDNAEETIELVTFVYWTGDVARAFARALAERARAGVRVRVILDAWGSRPMDPELIQIMTRDGVLVEKFRPVVRAKFWESDHRTHRKIMVVDSEVAFTGGVGIAAEWEGDARNPSEWRDTHFRVRGPAVLALRATFFTDWRDCGHVIEGHDLEVPPRSEPGGAEVAVIDGSAQIGYNGAERAIEALIASASHRILIATPYFNPPAELRALLKSAIDRGVELQILVPGPHIDRRICDVVAQSQYVPLSQHGASIWVYQPTMMHVKAILVDGVLSMVGSVNVNRRSVEKDEEVAITIIDEEITEVLETQFREDTAVSSRVTLSDERIPLHRRLLTLLLRPIRPEM